MSTYSGQSVTIRNTSVGLCPMLTVLFVGLRLTDHIDWSWIWVLSPMWIPLALGFGLIVLWFLFAMLTGGIAALVGAIRSRDGRR